MEDNVPDSEGEDIEEHFNTYQSQVDLINIDPRKNVARHKNSY